MKFETPEQLRSYLKSLPHLSDKGKDERVRKSKKDFLLFLIDSDISMCYIHTNLLGRYTKKEEKDMKRENTDIFYLSRSAAIGMCSCKCICCAMPGMMRM